MGIEFSSPRGGGDEGLSRVDWRGITFNSGGLNG